MKKYIIGAGTEKRAVQIANERGLMKHEWTRAHCGYPPHLKDGLFVADHNLLIGDFNNKERWTLTTHLMEGKANGKT